MDIAGTSGPAAELTADAGRYPLSANLELFCMFDKGDEQGALGPRHLMVTGWRVTGRSARTGSPPRSMRS